MKITPRHIALYPFALLYGLVTLLRNLLFDYGILRSRSFPLPIISVGNLVAGGTGKTPHTEYLLSLLSKDWNTAMLSRGYKRRTSGFVLADEDSTAQTLGDEPYQIYRKFSSVTVAVDEKRVHGVIQLLRNNPSLQTIVLDDAFQHRHISPGFSILLTDYSRLFTRDFLLPAGTLRELSSGCKRASVVIVTKCPRELSAMEMRLIQTELNLAEHQQLYFSSYIYDEITAVFPDSVLTRQTLALLSTHKLPVVLVTGIVSPKPIADFLLQQQIPVEMMSFPDHYAFQPKDFDAISATFANLPSQGILLVTEKDAARLYSSPAFPEHLKAFTYALPVRVKFLNNMESQFNHKIKNYVIENSRNS